MWFVSSPSVEPSVSRVALLLGTLVALTVVGSSAVAVALPEVAAELQLDKPGTAWIVAAFSLSFSITTAVFGRLADLQGLRRPLRIGVVLLVTGSIAAALAPNFPSIVVARLVQGAGAGAVPVLALGVLAARFEGVARGRALGALTAVVSIVSGSGPLIGGVIAELLGWRFVLAVPAVALLIMEPVARLAPAGGRVEGRIDTRGAALVAAFTTGLVLILQSPATRPGPMLLAASIALLVGGAIALRAHVRRRPNGFLPLRVVANRSVVLTSLAGLTLLAGYLAALLSLPLMFTDEHGWRPLQIGLAMVPAALLGAIASRVVGGTAQRLGRYRVAAWLALGSAAGLLVAAVGHSAPIVVLIALGPVVAGFAAGQVALIDGLPELVDEDVQGVALGLFNLVFFTGGAVGSAIVGGLGGAFSIPVALAGVALLPAAGAVASLMISRSGPTRPADAEDRHHRARHALHNQA
ncbi:MAG: MFS transporter [Nitriliruptorales bacterium]|nr:MFS transporter [Nitriliruptorales bacterium]